MFDYSFDIFLAKFASEFNALIRPFSWVWFWLFEHFQENCVFYWESLILLLIFIVDLNSDGRCWFFSRLFGSGSHWRCYCLADWLHLVVWHWHHSHLLHLIWDHHHRVLHLWYLIWHHHHWLALSGCWPSIIGWPGWCIYVICMSYMPFGIGWFIIILEVVLN